MAWWCNDIKPHQMVRSYNHIYFSSQTVQKIASDNVFFFAVRIFYHSVTKKSYLTTIPQSTPTYTNSETFL
jgi:hypothetical protein